MMFYRLENESNHLTPYIAHTRSGPPSDINSLPPVVGVACNCEPFNWARPLGKHCGTWPCQQSALLVLWCGGLWSSGLWYFLCGLWTWNEIGAFVPEFATAEVRATAQLLASQIVWYSSGFKSPELPLCHWRSSGVCFVNKSLALALSGVIRAIYSTNSRCLTSN